MRGDSSSDASARSHARLHNAKARLLRLELLWLMPIEKVGKLLSFKG